MAAPATPAAFYKMLGVPEAQELILAETAALPPVTLPFTAALHHTLAADVAAAEPVPGFRASIKVRGARGGCCMGAWAHSEQSSCFGADTRRGPRAKPS